MAVTLRRPCRRDDRIHELRMADSPLKGLLGAHREPDDRTKVRNLQFIGQQSVHRLDVVADRRYWKTGAMQRFRRVAG